MNRFIYYAGIALYVWGIRLAALFGKEKAKRWIKGREQWQQQLKVLLADNQAPILWMHCASLGEFEQGRPLLEALREQAPQYKILLSFFSPSGYEPRQDYPLADWVIYLPADTYGQAKQFLDLVHPQQVFFIKYEFWYGYLSALKKRAIPTYLIAANFRPNQIFFRWYGAFFKKLLFCFETIFVQTTASQELLTPLGLSSVVVAGDTRLDRVLTIKAQVRHFPSISQFCAQAPTLIAGSTWPADEALLEQWLRQHPDQQLLLVPHEIDEPHLLAMMERFSFVTTARYTNKQPVGNFPIRVLIIDQIGLLSALYGYGTAAYIGGGFGAGIHNCLEAVVYQLPIFFGPNYQKFQEAKALVAAGVATEVHNSQDLARGLIRYQGEVARTALQQTTATYLETQRGATLTILQHLSL